MSQVRTLAKPFILLPYKCLYLHSDIHADVCRHEYPSVDKYILSK